MSKPVSGKIKKNIINVSSVELAQRVVEVKTFGPFRLSDGLSCHITSPRFICINDSGSSIDTD